MNYIEESVNDIVSLLLDDYEKKNGEKIGIVLTLPVVLGVSFSF